MATFNDELENVVGSCVYSTVYGNGIILAVWQKEKKWYFQIRFEKATEPKTFLANTALSSGVFKFESDEKTLTVKALLNAPATSSSALRIEQLHPLYSNNPTVNELIGLFLKKEPIAQTLISQYGDETFESALLTEAFGYFEDVMRGCSYIKESDRACMVIAFSMIALKYYNGDLHSFIENKYREYRPQTQAQYTTATIRNAVYKILGPYRKIVQYFDEHSYVAVPLVLCCVPHYRVADLFRIAYDIYKQKLLFDEDVTDEQIEIKVHEALQMLRRKDLISDSDVIKGTNYLMSKYTQSCIYSGVGIEPLVNIIADCIRLIINHLSMPEDAFSISHYYLEGFEAWITAFEGDSKEKEKYERNRTVSQPYFRLINNNIHLFTGEYSMDDSFNPNYVSIRIYSGDELVIEKPLSDPNDIELDEDGDALGGYIINCKGFLLPCSPLDNLAYSIICDGQELYHSKSRLFRSHIFFDGKGNEVKPGTEYDGDIFVVTHGTNTEEYEGRINEVSRGSNYILSTMAVDSQNVYRFDGEPYAFFRGSGSKIISKEISWAEYVSAEQKRYLIYNDISILFQASCIREDVYIEVDGTHVSYGDDAEFDFWIQRISSVFDGNYTYVLKIRNIEAGYHTVRIFNGRTNKQIKGANFGLVCDPGMWKTFRGKTEKAIEYNLTSNFVGNQVITFEYGMPKKTFNGFVKNLGFGSLVIYPSSISYSIDGETWFDADHKLYLCDIPDSAKMIYICGPVGMSAYIENKDALVKRQMLNLSNDQEESTLYRLYIDYFRSIASTKSIRATFDYCNRTKFFNVWFNPYISKDGTCFRYDESRKVHSFYFEYEGKSQIKVVIRPLNSEEILISRVITSGQAVELSEEIIPKEVRFLSISVYGRRYGSLFDPFQKDPFITFPKYDLGRTPIKLTSWPPVITYNKLQMVLTMKFEFIGTERVKVCICPSGFNTPLYTTVIENGETVNCDVSSYLFRSYNVLLYALSDPVADLFSEKAFFVSKAIKVESPLWKQKYTISSFVMKGGDTVKSNYCIYFAKYEEISGVYYWICKLINNTTGSSIDNILVSVLDVKAFSYSVRIQRLIDKKIIKSLSFKDGGQIQKAIIDKLGGWK